MSSRPDEEALATDAAERRLEELAEEIEQVILGCPANERDALHGYAVSLVRDRLPPIEADEDDESAGDGADDEAEGTGERAGAGPNLVGYGILLVLVGLPLMIVFPLVGILLFGGGGAMSVLGLVLFAFARARPSAQTAATGGGK